MSQDERLGEPHRIDLPQATVNYPLAFGWLSKRPVPADVMTSYLRPMWRDAAIRRDLGKLLRGIDNRHTLAAAERFPGVTVPVLLAWAREDRLFPLRLGERLNELFPNARLETIDDSYTFAPEDQPEQLAELIASFAGPSAA